MHQHLVQAGGPESDVVDGAGAGRAALRSPAEVLLLVLAGHLRTRADVHDVDVTEVHPVHREAEVRVWPARHAEDAGVPIARCIDVVGSDEEVLDVRKGHALIYNDVYLGSQKAQRGGRAQDHGDRDPARQGSQAGGDHRDRRRRRPLDLARAHGRRQVPYRAFGHHQGGMRGVEQARHRIAGRRGTGARHRACARSRPRRRPGALDRDGRRLADHGGRRMHRRRRRRGRQLGIRRTRGAGSCRIHPMNVACIGMGWWSDVLADAIVRSGRMKIVSCYSRSRDKREAFARKYACTAAASYEEILGDRRIEAIINITPNSAHLETTSAAAAAGKHVFLDKPIANTIDDARAITTACRQAKVVLALGYQRRRESQFRWIKQNLDKFGKLVNAEANISRDRLGKIDLNSWRYTAAGMPGGVMLQIGIHYTDVLEYLIGPVKAVSGRFVRLVLPGDNPDVASLVLEHENGALSTLNASYASASEYYLMNIYGKEASAYYDMHQGF